ATTTVSLTVVGAISAQPDNSTTAFGQPVFTPVLANDQVNGTNATPATVTLTVSTPPSHGTAVVQNDGTIQYTPAPGYAGPDSYTYTICSLVQAELCATAVVSLTVGSAPPIANPDVASASFQQPAVLVPVLNNDTDKSQQPATLSNVTLPVIIQGPGNGTAVVVSQGIHAGSISYTAAAGFSGVDYLVYQICDVVDPTQCSSTTVSITVSGRIALLPKVYLQGALFGVYSPEVLMRDDLRAKNLLPTSSPYGSWSPLTATGGIASGVLSTTGANAIVDWVYVELRNASTPSQVVDSRSALLQRDGDIVDVDGVSVVEFSQVLPGSYYVAVRHRNHLGVMSQTALPLSTTTTVVDFRAETTPVFTYTASAVNQAQVVVAQGMAMWAGNALEDNNATAPHENVIYQGTSNDVNAIYQQVLNASGNVL
ncbi:Ig-like domain-containing protein, partial [Nibrella viscosa]|uniref:Ig-like domain-containing protein n=1 Tax=Nibrella viscosa TaxID=1084524 RepID=UPI0031E8A619